jgi:hypothetical protein
MKVAEVRYTGRGRRHSRRGPSDKRYSWQRTTTGQPDTVEEVDNVQDALYFAESGVFEVEWSPLGRLAKATEGPVTESEAALEQIGYRQKQKIAKSLGLKAGGSEDELDERIQPEIDRLKEQMET